MRDRWYLLYTTIISLLLLFLSTRINHGLEPTPIIVITIYLSYCNTLAIFENLLEFRPELCGDAGKQGLMQWLLRRIKAKTPFDANKLYASELLSILLQNTPENRLLLGELDGIDVLLQQLAYYKRHDPQTAEEQEMMENLFNVLCSSLMATVNRDRFLRGEGLQLMNLMLREKKMSRNGSLKSIRSCNEWPRWKR